VSLRPLRAIGQATTRHGSPARGGAGTDAVMRPSRPVVSSGSSAASPAAIPAGQSSAAHTTSGRTVPSAAPTEASGVHGAAHTDRPGTGPGKIRSPSPGARSTPQTKQPGKAGAA
jgi:hypothetical protein